MPLSQLLRFPLLDTTKYPQAPLAPCSLVGIAITVPLIQQDKLTRGFLISQQAVPYRTCGITCCPRVSTPMVRSLADSSMTIHITWWNPTVSTITTHAQTTTSFLTMVTSHHEWWKTKHSHKHTRQTQHLIRWKTCTTLMTTGLSKSINHKPNPTGI
jgi:hypothetical protein